MGYTTDFTGVVAIVPPLNRAEIDYLNAFAETRRMHRSNGPYYVQGSGDFGQGRDDDVIDYNQHPVGQPSLWCGWVPSDDGTAIEWNGVEKFHDADEWMAYLIDHFLKPAAVTSRDGGQFEQFTYDHVLNGCIEAQGEDPDDLWRLVVANNVVTRVDAVTRWPDGTPDVTS
jgi:hypothetical protein